MRPSIVNLREMNKQLDLKSCLSPRFVRKAAPRAEVLANRRTSDQCSGDNINTGGGFLPSPRYVAYRLIRPRRAKHSRHSLELNLLLPFFVSRLFFLHLTQPAGPASLHLGTGSCPYCPSLVMLPFLRWRVGSILKTHYFAHLGVINLWKFLFLFTVARYISISWKVAEIFTCANNSTVSLIPRKGVKFGRVT